MTIAAELRQQLIEAAIAARQRAYAPYSKFRVGAALVTNDGRLYTGANVENVSYGLTNCAERVALQTAVATGARKVKGIAIASSGGVTPCGACRQVLAEFSADCTIYLVDADRPAAVATTTLAALLPQRFAAELEGLPPG